MSIGAKLTRFADSYFPAKIHCAIRVNLADAVRVLRPRALGVIPTEAKRRDLMSSAVFLRQSNHARPRSLGMTFISCDIASLSYATSFFCS